ncbi:MAG: hypothetical protein AABX23_02355 [Nanoarchaeota archaeon]
MESKKVLLIILIIVLFSVLTGVKAALEDTEKQIEDNTGKLEDVADNIRKVNNKDFRNELIAKESLYFLNKTSPGRAIIKANDWIKKVNPFWNLVLGVNYSFSWGFWISFLIWLILFFLILPPTKIFFKNNIYSILSSFAITSLIGLAGIIRETVNLLGIIITNKISAGIVLIISIGLVVLSEKTKKLWKGLKEKEAKKQQERDREVLRIEAENIKNQTNKKKDN